MRIKTTLGITTFALLPFLIASCGSDGPATGVYTINATGGLGGSNGGTGGDGDYLNAYKEAGLGNVEMLRAGSANASFTSTTPATSLGDNAVAITANTTIGVETIEPATGTPYLIANTTTLWISDGNGTLENAEVAADQDYATGLSVASGATLTLELNTNAATEARIDVANDIRNSGTITTVDVDATNRGDLYLNASTYVGVTGSSINTAATLDSQNGGYVYIYADSIFNHGAITTTGFDSAAGNAGDGGYVYLYGNYNLENTANINTQGGDAAAGIAGNGDYIYLYGDYGYAYNRGNLNSSGGNGETGGSAGEIYMQSYLGDALNSGAATFTGGTGSAGNGGSGSDFYMYSYNGNVISNATLTGTGGATTDAASNGGNGGYVYLESDYSGYIYSYYHGVGDVLLSGNIDTSGGDAVATGTGNGGDAGYVELYAYNGGYVSNDARMAFLGYRSVDTSGGDGNYGGNAGDFSLYNEYSWDDGTYEYVSSGDVINEANVTARGGNAVATATTFPATGGTGGDFYLETAYYSGWVTPEITKVNNSGTANISGGSNLKATSTSNGRSGYVWLWGFNGVTNTAAITSNGGGDADTDLGVTGYGGYANSIEFYSELGEIANSAALTNNGGDGEYVGGYSNGIDLYGMTVSNHSSLTSNGGNASASLAGSTGGDGGWIELFSIEGLAGVSHGGTVSYTGGTGTTAGDDGAFMKGGMCTGNC